MYALMSRVTSFFFASPMRTPFHTGDDLRDEFGKAPDVAGQDQRRRRPRRFADLRVPIGLSSDGPQQRYCVAPLPTVPIPNLPDGLDKVECGRRR